MYFSIYLFINTFQLKAGSGDNRQPDPPGHSPTSCGLIETKRRNSLFADFSEVCTGYQINIIESLGLIVVRNAFSML